MCKLTAQGKIVSNLIKYLQTQLLHVHQHQHTYDFIEILMQRWKE